MCFGLRVLKDRKEEKPRDEREKKRGERRQPRESVEVQDETCKSIGEEEEEELNKIILNNRKLNMALLENLG